MAEGLARQSALDPLGLARSGGLRAQGLAMAEVPHLARLSVRGRAESIAAPFAEAFGVVLPTVPLSSSSAGDAAVLWLGPDEWWAVGPAGGGAAAVPLAAALAPHGGTVVDLTEARTVIRIAGPRARDLLAKGCPLDLHPRAFAAGRVARTVLGQVEAVLHRRSDDGASGAAVFDLHVLRSFAEWLWAWLADGAREYEA